MNGNKTFRKSLAAALSVVGISGAVMVMSAPPALADGTGHSLKIKSSKKGTTELYVCRDWEDNSRVDTSCPSASRYLPEGRNTVDYLGWNDVDGIRVPKGYKAKCDQVGADGTLYSNGASRTRWVKISPYISCGPGLASIKVYLVRR